MATKIQFGSGTLSATISPLLPDTLYYYTVTAFNGSTPGVTSSPVSMRTLPSGSSGGGTNSIVLINGKIFSENTKIAIAGGNVIQPTEKESANGTVVNTSGPIIYDGFLNKFVLTPGNQISINGVVAPSTSSVSQELYYNHTLYYSNTGNNWFTLSPTGVVTSVPTGDPRNPIQPTQGRIFNTTGGLIIMTDGSILSNTTTNS